MRRKPAYAVAVVRTAEDGTQDVTIAAAYTDLLRAVELTERLERAADKMNDDVDRVVHRVLISNPTLSAML